MHIYFSGIGGAGIGPLAQIAFKSGYSVSGSDKRGSDYISYLKKHGIDDIVLSQDEAAIKSIHQKNPIDWVVYTSALTLENENPAELQFCKENSIKFSKRDEFLNEFIKLKKLKMIAIAGTHGKTTTTAMLVWLFKQLGLPISYILPAKTNFADMGEYDQQSQYFIYEADEFDRNFLAFNPFLSVISGVAWDHHEIYKTQAEYLEAFRQFINQSNQTIIWQSDYDLINLAQKQTIIKLSDNLAEVDRIDLIGLFNRRDALLAITALNQAIDGLKLTDLTDLIKSFPGLSRRMEEIRPNLYSDYAHTPEKITAALNVISEIKDKKKLNNSKIIIIYEPLTNRRQHYIKDSYRHLFDQADFIYWVDSYLAREDPNQEILSPAKLISYLANPKKASPAKIDNELKTKITKHLAKNDLVLAISGGGGNSLDEWLRLNFL